MEETPERKRWLGNKNTVEIRAVRRNQLKSEATTWNDFHIPVNMEQIQKDDPDLKILQET